MKPRRASMRAPPTVPTSASTIVPARTRGSSASPRASGCRISGKPEAGAIPGSPPGARAVEGRVSGASDGSEDTRPAAASPGSCAMKPTVCHENPATKGAPTAASSASGSGTCSARAGLGHDQQARQSGGGRDDEPAHALLLRSAARRTLSLERGGGSAGIRLQECARILIDDRGRSARTSARLVRFRVGFEAASRDGTAACDADRVVASRGHVQRPGMAHQDSRVSDPTVYPRACGGTAPGKEFGLVLDGLSPRVRGNPCSDGSRSP